MDNRIAVEALGALAQDNRLAVYRMLVQAGPEGIAAGDLAERVGVPPNTLSFHLKTLSHANLVASRHAGRFVYYTANYEAMNDLIAFLGENCCGGRPCGPTAAVPRARRQA
jgi:DNA-binding transcriptional ArsR family regulator